LGLQSISLPFLINKRKVNSKGLCALMCRITYNKVRKTFATTVLLYNDVPMEIVSKLLGHSSMKITQDSYGKIVEKKISDEMERLKGS